MRAEFVAFFAGMESQIRESTDLPWLVAAIDEGGTELRERGFTLRADAFVFLFSNLRAMVVFPWAGSQIGAEAQAIVPIVRADVELVLRRAMDVGAQDEVSANALFQAVAELREELVIRSEEFWGP